MSYSNLAVVGMEALNKRVSLQLTIFWKRQWAGYSQEELAEAANVPLCTIQQYEQRQKSINKAQVEYLLQLSQALCCKVEDLIERVE